MKFNVKILSFQPFPMYVNGGGSRLLRRLYKGREQQIISLAIWSKTYIHNNGAIKEIIIPELPITRQWMRWHIRTLVIWLRVSLFYPLTVARLRSAVNKLDYDILHIVNHDQYSTILCKTRFTEGKKVWVSFHDHYLLCSNFKDTNYLWNKADRRLVISRELGDEYRSEFGALPYEIITDGIAKDEVSNPNVISSSSLITVYFAGLLHIDYYDLFHVLADALDQLIIQGINIRLVLRGTQKIDFLNNRRFIVDYRSNFITDDELKEELDFASILYLPIKFNKSEFYLYSLSTKMVSYLAASGSILYHGPANSAACNLLKQSSSAICCTSLELNDLIESFNSLLYDKNDVSHNAKKLAKRRFNLTDIQERFWQVINK